MKLFFDSSVLVPVFYADHPQHGFPIAGNKHIKIGARFWEYRLSIPENRLRGSFQAAY